MPHCHFNFVKFNITVSVYGKYCSLQRWQENHEALKIQEELFREKGRSYSVMPFLEKSITKDTGCLSGMITSLYTERTQKLNWHFNLNIQNCWSWRTQLPLLYFFLLQKLVTDSLQFGMLSVVITHCPSHGCCVLLTPHHCSSISDIRYSG